MKYLKYYYIFNEANFSTESDLDEEEREFLNKVKKERPLEYNKYLTFIKSKYKGLGFAKRKYNDTDPKNIAALAKESEREAKRREIYSKRREIYSKIVSDRNTVRHLIPTLKVLDQIFLDKFQKPYEDFWNYFYGAKSPFNFFNKKKSKYEDIWDEYVLNCDNRYANTKKASCNIRRDDSYLVENTPNGLANFISQYLDGNNITDVKPIKTELRIYDENNDFHSFSSDFRMYIHTSLYAVSVQIHFDVKFGLGSRVNNFVIFNSNKKSGSIKKSSDVKITQQDIINCINDAFDILIKDMDNRKDKAKKNMQYLIADILKNAVRSGEFLRLSKEHNALHNVLMLLNGEDNINKAIQLDDMGFND